MQIQQCKLNYNALINAFDAVNAVDCQQDMQEEHINVYIQNNCCHINHISMLNYKSSFRRVALHSTFEFKNATAFPPKALNLKNQTQLDNNATKSSAYLEIFGSSFCHLDFAELCFRNSQNHNLTNVVRQIV
eukprot:TRINITY_DN9966_c0_g2_i2.p1 TRINITY_DN9966_c0_g2~~TRINITY_DN9966_c0_g2_i2.p1  ORF type:complete len:132 (+),score=1.97 TRINITY_DN9966_c0_g2_i2:110-505(+)